MQFSEELDKFAAAMCLAQNKFPVISKTSEVDFTHNGKRTQYSYADLSVFLEAVREPLFANGLSYLQDVTTSDNGGISVATMILHKSGQWWQSGAVIIRPSDSKPQSAGSSATYARRYSLCCCLGLTSKDDDDDAAENNQGPAETELFTGTAEQMGIISQLFGKYALHKDDRMKITNFFIDKKTPANYGAIEKAIEAYAEKRRESEGKDPADPNE